MIWLSSWFTLRLLETAFCPQGSGCAYGSSPALCPQSPKSGRRWPPLHRLLSWAAFAFSPPAGEALRQSGGPHGDALLGSGPHVLSKACKTKPAPGILPAGGTCLFLSWWVSSSEIVCIFVEELQQNLFIFFFRRVTVRRCNFHVSRGKTPFGREKWDVVRIRSRLSHPTLLLSLSFCVYLPFTTHKSLTLKCPSLAVSYLRLQQRDSLAGSPGKHAWGLDLHGSMGFTRGLWCLPLYRAMKTSLSQQTGQGQGIAQCIANTGTHCPNMAGAVVSLELGPQGYVCVHPCEKWGGLERNELLRIFLIVCLTAERRDKRCSRWKIGENNEKIYALFSIFFCLFFYVVSDLS